MNKLYIANMFKKLIDNGIIENDFKKPLLSKNNSKINNFIELFENNDLIEIEEIIDKNFKHNDDIPIKIGDFIATKHNSVFFGVVIEIYEDINTIRYMNINLATYSVSIDNVKNINKECNMHNIRNINMLNLKTKINQANDNFNKYLKDKCD